MGVDLQLCEICEKEMDNPYELNDKIVCLACYSSAIDEADYLGD